MVVVWRKARVLESSGEKAEVEEAAVGDVCDWDVGAFCSETGAAGITAVAEMVAVEGDGGCDGSGSDAGIAGAEARMRRG